MNPVTLLRSAAAAAVVAAAPLQAAPAGQTISLRAGPLAQALHDLARQTGTSLLFAPESVRGLPAPRIRGRMSVERALARLLAGTNLAFRRVSGGSYVIEPRPAAKADVPSLEEALSIPEILVTGKLTRNTDIRRREQDVQPYRVTTGRRIARAHRDNLEQYFRSRVTGNTQAVAPAQSNNGETFSEIDLRGLGPEATLVLVDGRRMPSILTSSLPYAFRQSDLTAIPIHAVERVETLTGTAGGIYGFGALGGVVNVVLDRDYRGAQVHATGGISSRFDSGRWALEGRLGFTPDGGRTDVMLYLGRSRSRPLRAGQRDYLLRDDRGLGNSVAVTTFSLQRNLVFKPEFGGSALGSDRSFLPVGVEGSAADVAALLTANAGRTDASLADGQKRSEIGSTADTDAAMLDIRHRAGGGIELFLDGLILRNRGLHRSFGSRATLFLQANSPANPFTTAIRVDVPLPSAATERRLETVTRRFTAGLVAELPFGWRGTGEATFGSARFDSRSAAGSPTIDSFRQDLDAFRSWSALQSAAIAEAVDGFTAERLRSRYREQALRLAGPLFETPAGTTTLTLLAERRTEKVPGYGTEVKFDFDDRVFSWINAPRGTRTTSFYGELKAPLIDSGSSVPLLRGLELQLAVRREAQKVSFSRFPRIADPNDPDNFAPPPPPPPPPPEDGEGEVLEPEPEGPPPIVLEPRMEPSFAATSFTAGAKVRPAPWLLLRGSYATGRLPPPIEGLIDVQRYDQDRSFRDPRRGGTPTTAYGYTLRKLGGSPDLEMVKASTLALGAVLMPMGETGPRLSLDFSRIRRTGDPYPLDDEIVLGREEEWPERVVRAPLTEEDREQGYTGGRILEIDVRAINGSSRLVRTLDAQLDWPMRFLGGELRLYGAATYQMRNSTRGGFEEAVDGVGYRTGPLRWRANGGFDWSRGPTEIGLNVQYFDRYRISALGEFDPPIDRQGSAWIPAQAYVDLYAVRRLSLGRREVSLNLGIVNLLDKSPPRETGVGDRPGFSRYGDPRRRRFELVLSAGL
jgi:outer membrane receptor protein involved in Fe transport